MNIRLLTIIQDGKTTEFLWEDGELPEFIMAEIVNALNELDSRGF